MLEMEIIGCLVSLAILWICAWISVGKIEEICDAAKREHVEKRRQRLLRKNFKWRRRQKSPFVWDTNGKDPFEHLDTTYMDAFAKDDYRQRQRNKVLELCGAKFRYRQDAYYYNAAKRIPVVDSYGKILCYHVPGNLIMSCYPEEMPELSHVELARLTNFYAIKNGRAPIQEGDIIWIEHYRDGWFARIVKILKDRHFEDRQILKLEPVFSTPENPNGWICGDEIEYAYTHNTPPVPSKESIACA